MPEWLLEWIRCPQTGEGLRLADRELMANVNWLYRIDDDTPSLLADEAVNLKLTDLRKA
jgi:uncharacterized protein YbaR (Trm112 family)